MVHNVLDEEERRQATGRTTRGVGRQVGSARVAGDRVVGEEVGVVGRVERHVHGADRGVDRPAAVVVVLQLERRDLARKADADLVAALEQMALADEVHVLVEVHDGTHWAVELLCRHRSGASVRNVARNLSMRHSLVSALVNRL